jgi:hypothetical protein
MVVDKTTMMTITRKMLVITRRMKPPATSSSHVRRVSLGPPYLFIPIVLLCRAPLPTTSCPPPSCAARKLRSASAPATYSRRRRWPTQPQLFSTATTPRRRPPWIPAVGLELVLLPTSSTLVSYLRWGPVRWRLSCCEAEPTGRLPPAGGDAPSGGQDFSHRPMTLLPVGACLMSKQGSLREVMLPGGVELLRLRALLPRERPRRRIVQGHVVVATNDMRFCIIGRFFLLQSIRGLSHPRILVGFLFCYYATIE